MKKSILFSIIGTIVFMGLLMSFKKADEVSVDTENYENRLNPIFELKDGSTIGRTTGYIYVVGKDTIALNLDGGIIKLSK